MNKYLVISLYFEKDNAHPSYEFVRLFNKDELMGTDYDVPQRIRQATVRVEKNNNFLNDRLCIKIVTRVQ